MRKQFKDALQRPKQAIIRSSTCLQHCSTIILAINVAKNGNRMEKIAKIESPSKMKK